MNNVPLSAQGFVLEWSSGSRTRFRSSSSSSVRLYKKQRCCRRSLQPAGCADVKGGKGDRVWGMLHGGPQFSGLSYKNNISPVSRQAGVSSEAISEGGAPRSTGREAGRSGWQGLLRCHLFSLQPLGGWMWREGGGGGGGGGGGVGCWNIKVFAAR